MTNWESLHYTPWHVQRAKPTENDKAACDSDVEDIVRAQEKCYMLFELLLVECSRKFVNLNVSSEVFKPMVINDDKNEEEHTKSFI